MFSGPGELGLSTPPFIDVMRERASDRSSRFSNTGENRSSKNWSTSDACDGTRTRRTWEAKKKIIN